MVDLGLEELFKDFIRGQRATQHEMALVERVRLNRLVLIKGAVLLILPYAIALIALLWPSKRPPERFLVLFSRGRLQSESSRN